MLLRELDDDGNLCMILVEETLSVSSIQVLSFVFFTAPNFVSTKISASKLVKSPPTNIIILLV